MTSIGEQLAEKYNVSVDYLLCKTNDPSPNDNKEDVEELRKHFE